MFGPKTYCVVIVGAQWGDEGKGKIVDVLAEEADLVVRYQGGANAGHTVVTGDDEFILHQIPSGILHQQTMCIIGNGVVLDPETFFTELDQLVERGIDVASRVFVSDRAHLVMPYHKLLDTERDKSQKIGTTGRGIGPAYEDKTGRRGLRVGDLRYPDKLPEMLRERVERVNELLQMMGSEERASLDQAVTLLSDLAPRMLPLASDTGLLVHRALTDGKNVLLEGAQGALLDLDHGTYPYVTSSNTTAGGAVSGTGIGPTALDEIVGVVPLPTEAEGDLADQLREYGGEFGATTGRPRRCGWFDATVARYSVRVNGLTALAVTKLDVLDHFAEIPIGVAYDLDGEHLEEMPADLEALSRVQPQYEVLPGWQKPTSGARHMADLPPEARAYLDRLQDLLGTPIRYVSVGTRRDQIIEV